MQIRSAGPTLFRGTAVPQFQTRIVTIAFFALFFDLRFLTLKKTVFSHFGWFWAPPKSTPTLQKACFYLSESMIFKKSCFFCKKTTFQKTPKMTLKKPPKRGLF